MNGVTEIDHCLVRKSLRKFAGEDEAILKSVVTLSTADDLKQIEMDYASSESCSLCGNAEGGYEDLMVCCPKLLHVRESSPLSRILKFLPAAILRGLPPAMGQTLTGAYWKEAEHLDATRAWDDFRKIQPKALTTHFLTS